MRYKNLIIPILILAIINALLLIKFKNEEKLKIVKKVNVMNHEEEKEKELVFFSDSIQKRVSNKLEDLLTKENKYKGFHGSVLVSKNDSILFTGYYGMANFKDKTPIDSNSVFQLASVSKQFTAASIMILHEQKKLNLIDKVTKYFPEFPYKNVTIEQLLNHTSGLPSYFYLAEKKWQKQELPQNDDMIHMFEKHKPYRYFRPGRLFKYSNSGYLVLAAIVENVSGTNLNDFMQANIFKPLHMQNTFVYRATQDSTKENQLMGYIGSSWRKRKIIDPYWEDAITGDKNVYSNAIDLYKWMKGLNSGKIVSDSTLKRMYAKSHTSRGRSIPYGYGFRINSNKEDGKIIYHNGKWNGFRTSLKQYMEDDIRIVILEHTNYPDVSKLADRLEKEVVKVLHNSEEKKLTNKVVKNKIQHS